jgi:hypothetical protein
MAPVDAVPPAVGLLADGLHRKFVIDWLRGCSRRSARARVTYE